MGSQVSALARRLEAIMGAGAAPRTALAPACTGGPEPPLPPGALGLELYELLEASSSMGPEQVVAWQRWVQLPAKGTPVADAIPWQKLATRSALLLAEAAAEAVDPAAAELSSMRTAAPGEAPPWLLHLCRNLEALDAVLATLGSLQAASLAEEVLPKLDSVWDVLRRHAKTSLLKPVVPENRTTTLRDERLAAGDVSRPAPRAATPVLCEEALRLPLQILARCSETGPEALGAQELWDLGNGDLGLVACSAVAAMRTPGLRASVRLKRSLWRSLKELASSHYFSSSLSVSKEKSSEMDLGDLVSEHPPFAHAMASCLIQADALEVCCDAAGSTAEAEDRLMVVSACMELLHSLCTGPNSWGASKLMGRRITVLWPRFGYRVLAPQLRRLLHASESGGSAARAARELRRDLRTMAWLLYHAPELGPFARPLAAEVAARCAQSSAAPETLAIAVACAANAGALNVAEGAHKETTLLETLGNLEQATKSAVQLCLYEESDQRLWIVREAWPVVESLGLWPASEETARREADIAAIAKLQPDDGAGFSAILPGGVDEEMGVELAKAELPEAEAMPPVEAVAEAEEVCVADAPSKEEEALSQAASGGEAVKDSQRQSPGPPPLGALGIPSPEPSAHIGGARGLFSALCSAPPELRCAIDGRICTEPTLAAPGGDLLDVLYQRSSIMCWLSHRNVCPVTGVPLKVEDLIPASDRSLTLLHWAARLG
eukprot:s1238_g3.t1